MTGEAKQKIVLWYQKYQFVHSYTCDCEPRNDCRVGLRRGRERGQLYLYCDKCHYDRNLSAMEFHSIQQLFMGLKDSRDFLARDLLINIAVAGMSMLFLLPMALATIMHSFFWITGVVFCLVLILAGMSEVLSDQELIKMIDKKDDSI